jgi:adenine phosphoribosyltransferase
MKKSIDLRQLIRERPDKRRCDLTPLFGNAEALRQTVLHIAEPFRMKGVTKVAGLEGMGLALAGAVAQELRSGLVLFRKPGLLAWDTHSVTFADYTGESKAFEIASDALAPGDRVLVVDDWTETGSQLQAAFQMIERQRATVVGAALVNIDPAVRRDPRFRSYELRAVLEY